MKRKICVVTGTRAEYGLLKSIMHEIQSKQELELKIIVTGMHLLKKFGFTIEEIKKDGFRIDATVDMHIRGDSTSDMALSLGYGIIGMTQALKSIHPDILLVLGDRGEAFAATIAASYLNIVVAHIHGGDQGDGGLHIDDKIRHAITKLAHIHFPATSLSAQRLEKMGEEKWRICLTGAPGLDAILARPKKSADIIAKKFNLDTKKEILLVIQHPSLADTNKSAYNQMQETMEAIKELCMQTVVLYPNADAGGREMIKVIDAYKSLPYIRIYNHLNRDDFLDLMQISQVMIGNSSSGTIEAPLFSLPVVNVGRRESTRETVGNKIFVSYNREEIVKAVHKALHDTAFIKGLRKYKSPYGDGHASEKIVNFLASVKLDERIFQKVL